MRELTKAEKRQAKDVIRIGILRRHAEWLRELRELLDQPYDEETNEFDRSMTVTDKSRKFYKEAMGMEQFYNNTMLIGGLTRLLYDGYIFSQSDSLTLSTEFCREKKSPASILLFIMSGLFSWCKSNKIRPYKENRTTQKGNFYPRILFFTFCVLKNSMIHTNFAVLNHR